MTKQEKLDTREKLILENAREIVKNDGIFEFKMSSIAKVSKLSIGTLYMHFLSKEDVIIALACEAIKELQCFFIQANELDFTHKQKLLAFTFASHIRRSKENFVCELEQIVTNTSVRNRASKQRTKEHDDLIQKTISIVKSTILKAVKEDKLSLEKEEDICNNMLFGLWSLSLGSLSILELNIFEKHDLDIKNPLVQNAAHLINSYIIENKIDDTEIKQIIAKTNQLISKGNMC